eukprot:GAFH01005562.1.p2 GENE.GAFH01005562.1~~GAFH01005562.1.p2  ORF type:complete len:187 (-),score=5.37 GAFH01005562.1:38-598(-)
MLHSVASRANTIFTFYTTVLGVVVVCIALTSFLFPFEPTGRMAPRDVLLRKVEREQFDLSRFAFDLDADLRGAFHWNTKQLFVWITAEYETPDFPQNEVVVWDHIIQEKENAVLHLSNQMIKYPFYDREAELRNANVKLRLRYALCPHSGFLWTLEATNATVTMPMPAHYTTTPAQSMNMRVGRFM